ncbi:hypothetical protein [Blastococcus sp. CT_GayMR16]|uniref:hypothetical protein n=1 Tax=Blastococcus sp. CT_GayMR16 TaxID=2559607 RepID=UPI001074177D|nr:hypothetical protein [Blastococcus sp. CT_GayMR16]TFV83147.1 hypothetical protein E4P38_21055 [Blastococcus sp. CT_GayMR16]
MNRYVVDGVLADMRASKRVVVVAESGPLARRCLDECEARAVAGEKVRRAHGEERIEHPYGGRITFHTIRGGGLRGVAADVVYVDADATLEQIGELRLIVSASPGGEVIRR